MYRKILLAGTTAAVIVGAGGTALAVSGSDTTSGSAATHTSQHAKKAGKHGKKGRSELRRLAHGSFTTKGKGGKFITHDLIRGTVSSVSATSITVQAADKKSETFSITKDTKVLQRTAVKKPSGATTKVKPAKPATSSIDKVAKGDHVFVAGTGTSTLTAKRVLDIKG